MSFSKPVEEMQSPVNLYLDTNARDGEIRLYDKATGEKKVLKKPEFEAIILDAGVAMYSGYQPNGDHYWSNHFRTGRGQKSWAVINGKQSGVVLEGNPHDKTFKEEAKKMKPALKYVQLLYLNYGGTIAVMKVKGTVLQSFLDAKRKLGGSVDNSPLMKVRRGNQKTVQGQKIWEFIFEFSPLAADEKLVKECVEMDEIIQPWLDAENSGHNAANLEETTEKNASAEEQEDLAEELVDAEDDIDKDF